MTTNVFDKARNILASDSRWSYPTLGSLSPLGQCTVIPYVDNTGYDKISFDEDSAYIFAGDALVIDDWKKWLTNPNHVLLPRPTTPTGFAVCITDLETGDIVFEHGQKIRELDSRFAGTGSLPAYACWKENRDAKKSVASAIAADIFSGGDVKFLHGSDLSKHNLQPATPFSVINALFLTRGMVIYMNQNQGLASIPIDQAAQNDPGIKELVEQVKAGGVSAKAPSGFDPVVWTQYDQNRLDVALAERAQKRASRTK